MKIKKIFSYLWLWTIIAYTLWLWTYTNAYTKDFFIWWEASDWYVLHWKVEYALMWNDAETWQKNWNNYEIKVNPLVKYTPWIFWVWHLWRWKWDRWLIMWKDKDDRVTLIEPDEALKDANSKTWENQYSKPYWEEKFQVDQPKSQASVKLTEDIEVTTRPVKKEAQSKLKFYIQKSNNWQWKYTLYDVTNPKNPINIEWKNIFNKWDKKYRPVFILSMRAVLMWNTWQLNFITRWKFSWMWKKFETNTNQYSDWIDAKAFYISNFQYTDKNTWNKVSWEWKSAVLVWRDAWLYFDNKIRDWAKLEDLQRWYRPQLVWTVPLLKINVWKSWNNTTYYTSLYWPFEWKSYWLQTNHSKWIVYSDWQTVHDLRLSRENITKCDEQWLCETYDWEKWYYPKADLIWKSKWDWWITWNNQLYRLWAWNNYKWWLTDLTWKMYSYDHRYSYYINAWFCWDWMLQDEMWEQCDLWVWNWEWWSCSLSCKNQESTCWNWKLEEKTEECDWKMFEWKPADMSILPLWLKWQTWLTYTWKNNPCYKPWDEIPKWRKACQWKKPYWKIELSPKVDVQIKDWSDVRDMILSELPIWADIATYQWFQESIQKKLEQSKWEQWKNVEYIKKFPIVTKLYAPNVLKWTPSTPDQLKALKWLDWIWKLNLYEPKLNQIWRFVYKEEKNTDNIKIWSQLTNNVAVKYWYSPLKNEINNFVTDLPEPIKKFSWEDLTCKSLKIQDLWNNKYQITWNFWSKSWLPPSNKIINDARTKFSVNFKSWRKFIEDLQISSYQNKNKPIVFPVLTQDEEAIITVQWYNEDAKVMKQEICPFKLKFNPLLCDPTTSHNWINNPHWDPFDANYWIYSW